MRFMMTLAGLIVLCAWLGACVERKERLTISPDGSVLWQVQHRADTLDDLLNGDAVPTPGGLWIVSQQQQRDEEGRVTHILNAETAFARGRALPRGFGSQREIEDGACMVFPTKINFERRADAIYVHFARRYEPRAWRHIEALREQHITNFVGGLNEDPATWSPVQRMNVTQALVRFEIEKHLALVRAAWNEALANEPQDRWLAIADDVRSLTLTIDFVRLSSLLEPPEDEIARMGLDDAIKLEGRQLQQSIIARVGEAAQQAGLDGSKSASLLAGYELQRRILEVTEDLGDDTFEIEVEMPGTIVASNANELEGSVSGNLVTWKFKGEQVRDNAIELLATSRIAR